MQFETGQIDARLRLSRENLRSGRSIDCSGSWESDRSDGGGENVIARGASALEVAQVLGTPDRKPGNDVWFYHNYNAGSDQSPDYDCHI